jgi:hypothetical protein
MLVVVRLEHADISSTGMLEFFTKAPILSGVLERMAEQ